MSSDRNTKGFYSNSHGVPGCVVGGGLLSLGKLFLTRSSRTFVGVGEVWEKQKK